ncbi:MAG: Flp pilus assembly protein CpaB [Candidatus Omnitrophica bacterium CG11_big_fil_rev_8_21_14_0_20_63_9]|nr:MAG: Flp pilus assembly protein CpaB [Candidatus Omnitrophica bacterium CG11_big_fil_rev_8_21_14_0_20_63_9]
MNPLTGNLKRLLPVAFAIVMGLVAVGLMQNYLAQQRRLIEAERQKIQQQMKEVYSVIVAKRDIAEGTAITATDLTTQEVPKQFIAPYATGRTADLEGQVALAPIAAGEQVLTNKVRKPSEMPLAATLSGLMPEGKRAITIQTNAITGVGGFVRPGDTVDILWTVQLPEQQGGEKVTFVLFQDVNILAVGRQMIGKQTSDQESSDVYTVTVALAPIEASLLLYARNQGDKSENIQLSLRARNDKGEQVNIPVADSKLLLSALLGEQATQPPPPPPPMHRVEVYKGLEKTIVQIQKD